MLAVLSHYRILEQIGEGGMGVVYRAHDQHLDRDVALKVLPAGTLSDESARKRFRKEALALSKLNHPNIATVFDFDTQDGTDFLVEELIEGLPLDAMLASAPLSEREIVNLGTQLCEGVAAAHERGLIHRDLKPANIRVTHDARLKILDFGLAQMMRRQGPSEPTASLTETHSVSGTLPYMAPEQLLNEKLDARTDIWAVGCVLYEMATARHPFLGSGPALIDAILHGPSVSPSALNPHVSAQLTAIILKCLEKDRSLRYQSTAEIAVDLRRMVSASAIVPTAVPTPRPRARPVLIGVAVVVLAALLGLAAFLLWRRAGKVPQPAQVTPSIAVLPFVNMSSDKEQEYFSDGLAEELLNTLAKIPELKVTARTSSFQFKGKNEDLRVIGEKLNVGTVLEGSVRKQGNRARITVQLIKVSDGYHLWSETYDKDVMDIFAVQEDIARSVAASMKVTLLGAKTPSRGATDAETYNAYLLGRYFVEQHGEESLGKAVGYYEQAIKRDSGYAPAWAGLSLARSFQAGLGFLPFQEGYEQARKTAARALALDDNLAEAHAAMAEINLSYDWDWESANASYQRALALEPGNASIVAGAAGLASTLGRFEEALSLDRRAVELDPLNTWAHRNHFFDAYYTGRLEEAASSVKKILELKPDASGAHFNLGRIYLAQFRLWEALAEMKRETGAPQRLQGEAMAYHALGRKKESDAALAELIAKFQAESAFQIAEVCAFRGEADQAFQWLERAYSQRDPGLTFLKGDPLLRNLERDPRYPAFLRKMRLPQ